MFVHEILYTFVSSFVALFPVMNPVGSGLIVNGFLEGMDETDRKTAIKKIVRNCLLVGLGSLAIGHVILLLFGLAVPVIQLGGGIIICKTGLEWLNDDGNTKTDNAETVIKKINIRDVEKKLFYPIAFPIGVGPGAISVIFTLMAAAVVKNDFLRTGVNYTMMSLAIIALLVILYLFLSQGGRIMKKLGHTGNMIINKLIAFITFCIGIQIIVTGISRIFHLNIL